MVINVKDTSVFLPKSKVPSGFRQMGRVTMHPRRSGLLLYQEETGDFYGMFPAGLAKLDSAEVLPLLGLAYIKNDPRETSARGGRRGRGRSYSKSHMEKMWEAAKFARIRRNMSA